MAVSEDDVRQVFRGLENGNRAKFFDHVADYVDWIVEGAHSLAAHYRSKDDLLAGSFANRILPLDARLIVEHVMVKDDQAVVELRSFATAKDGVRFDTRYCWVVHFAGEIIDRVRAYLDSAMVARLFDENRNLIQPPRRSHNGKVRAVSRELEPQSEAPPEFQVMRSGCVPKAREGL